MKRLTLERLFAIFSDYVSESRAADEACDYETSLISFNRAIGMMPVFWYTTYYEKASALINSCITHCDEG